ncbi:MAG: site-2 protease family protein [Planctomycetes bacterium]|nr:site-2 protease family protein [Planctomycetota bacterium]
MNWENAILWFVVLIISLTVHEASHALFAFLGGDRTAYRGGQMTLNPIPHMRREPFGMLILPTLSLLMSNGNSCFGFAHAPIDPFWAARHPRKAALMSAGGPLANILLAAIAFAVLYGIARPDGDTARTIARIASVFLVLNVVLAVLNLLPMPPLDGAGVVQGLFPKSQRFYDSLLRIPYMSMVPFVLMLFVLPKLYLPVLRLVASWLPDGLRYL